MNVLLVLARGNGNVVSRQEFFDTVWPNADISDEVLSRCIYQLRMHFGDNGRQHAFIATIPKRGYRLVVAAEPMSNPADSDVVGARALWWPKMAATAGAVFALLIFFMYDPPSDELVDRQPAILPGSAAPSVVVIPYLDLSESGDKQFLSEGVTEELLAGLGQIRGLRVLGRESAMNLKTAAASPQEYAERLGVDVILAGSVRQSGDRIRVNTRLVDAVSGEQIWSASFDGQAGELFDIEDRIVGAVVRELQIQLQDNVSGFRVRRLTPNDRAHRLYQEGRFYLNRRGAGALQQAADYFEQALHEDPGFVLAYSGLADASMLLSQYGGVPLQIASATAHDALDTAFRIDSTYAELHASRGLLLLHNGELDAAVETLRIAAAMDPGYAPAHLWLGRALDLSLQSATALAAYRRAFELDPLSPLLNMNVGRMLMLAGRHTEAKSYFDTGLEFAREFGNLHWAAGFNAYWLGDLDAAEQAYLRAIEAGLDYESRFFANLAVLYTDRQDFDNARHYLEEAERLNGADYQSVLARKRYYLAQGRVSDLVDYLERLTSAEPERGDLAALTAAAYAWQGDYSSAANEYGRAETLASRTVNAELWDLAWGMPVAADMAHVFEQLGEYDRRDEMLWRFGESIADATDRGLNLPPLHYSRAVWYLQRGRRDDALREMQTPKLRAWQGLWLQQVDPKLLALSAEQD